MKVLLALACVAAVTQVTGNGLRGEHRILEDTDDDGDDQGFEDGDLDSQYFEGDIMATFNQIANSYEFDIAEEAEMAGSTVAEQDGLAGTVDAGSNRLWSGGVVYYEVDYDSYPDNAPTYRIANQMIKISDAVGLTFIEDATAPARIVIKNGSGCSSYVGMQGYAQTVTIQFDSSRSCMWGGVLIHEIVHALGLWHEQSQNGREDYVAYYPENLVPGYEYNFAVRTQTTGLGVPYDYGSIMHYGSRAGSQNGWNVLEAIDGPGGPVNWENTEIMGQRKGLSILDKMVLQMMYHCTISDPTLNEDDDKYGPRNIMDLCDSDCPCHEGQGNCKSDSDCADGLVCVEGDGSYEYRLAGEAYTGISNLNVCRPGSGGAPVVEPTPQPTPDPTHQPTKSPTQKPTQKPTHKPTASPTQKPTHKPTHKPTTSPTQKPTHKPTTSPTQKPTHKPTNKPTASPVTGPTSSPTQYPTTLSPTRSPTNKPTHPHPTASPTSYPTASTSKPTHSPTHKPTHSPTHKPTHKPTPSPTTKPTPSPTNRPTAKPTESPVKAPTFADRDGDGSNGKPGPGEDTEEDTGVVKGNPCKRYKTQADCATQTSAMCIWYDDTCNVDYAMKQQELGSVCSGLDATGCIRNSACYWSKDWMGMRDSCLEKEVETYPLDKCVSAPYDEAVADCVSQGMHICERAEIMLQMGNPNCDARFKVMWTRKGLGDDCRREDQVRGYRQYGRYVWRGTCFANYKSRPYRCCL